MNGRTERKTSRPGTGTSVRDQRYHFVHYTGPVALAGVASIVVMGTRLPGKYHEQDEEDDCVRACRDAASTQTPCCRATSIAVFSAEPP
jgi:hypothetical protein